VAGGIIQGDSGKETVRSSRRGLVRISLFNKEKGIQSHYTPWFNGSAGGTEWNQCFI